MYVVWYAAECSKTRKQILLIMGTMFKMVRCYALLKIRKYKTICVSLTPVCGQVLNFIIIGNYIPSKSQF